MGKVTVSSSIALLAWVMAVPKAAHGYMDPGAGSMLWQVAAAGAIGTLFGLRAVAAWIGRRVGLRPERVGGFVFATCFAVLASTLTVTVFQSHALPRFNDLFLAGIALTTYLFTWEQGTYLLCFSLLVSAWVLPPAASFRIEGFSEWYRFVSFGILSIFMICLITRMKARRQAIRSGEAGSYPMGATAGAD